MRRYGYDPKRCDKCGGTKVSIRFMPDDVRWYGYCFDCEVKSIAIDGPTPITPIPFPDKAYIQQKRYKSAANLIDDDGNVVAWWQDEL